MMGRRSLSIVLGQTDPPKFLEDGSRLSRPRVLPKLITDRDLEQDEGVGNLEADQIRAMRPAPCLFPGSAQLSAHVECSFSGDARHLGRDGLRHRVDRHRMLTTKLCQPYTGCASGTVAK